MRGYVPYAATFAAFFSRAYDFIRMAAVSQADIRLCGSHAGVEIGQDGPSQMGLEDIAAMRAVHGSTVLYPSDATSAAALTTAMADIAGVSYLRTTRGAYPVLYDPDESFPVGGSKILRLAGDDSVLLAGAGVTVHSCLEAAEKLAAPAGSRAGHRPLLGQAHRRRRASRRPRAPPGDGSSSSRTTIPRAASAKPSWPPSSPLDEQFRVEHLAVRGLPGSGTPAELMEDGGHLGGPTSRLRPCACSRGSAARKRQAAGGPAASRRPPS